MTCILVVLYALALGLEALVTARVEVEPGPLAALLEVVLAPASEGAEGSARY